MNCRTLNTRFGTTRNAWLNLFNYGVVKFHHKTVFQIMGSPEIVDPFKSNKSGSGVKF